MSKIEQFWQDATADDVARVMAGETVEARFRDDEKSAWFISSLAGWTAGMIQWYSTDDDFWTQCQVYREPSWWINKPDPGPGYRLLEKLPDEEPQLGDSVFCPDSEIWLELEDGFDPGQLPTHWYRRRIEPAPKFAVEQMVRVVEPKATDASHWSEEMRQHVGKASTIKAREKKDAGWFYELGCSAIWAFREDYIEPVNPEPKHYVLRVGDSVETPIGHRIEIISMSEAQRFYALTAGDKLTLPNGQTITITAKGFEVTQ